MTGADGWPFFCQGRPWQATLTQGQERGGGLKQRMWDGRRGGAEVGLWVEPIVKVQEMKPERGKPGEI